MRALLFRFCLVCNTHEEQRWYQHVGKRMLRAMLSNGVFNLFGLILNLCRL